MKIELIVLDLAGTTVEDHQDVHRALIDALHIFGVGISIEEANRVMGIPKPVAIRQLLREKNYPAVTTGLIGEMHAEFVGRMIRFYKEDSSVREKEGVSDTFFRLKTAGIKIAVDTGFDRKITDALLSRMQWIERGLIDVSVTSDEVAHGRPAPDLIYRAMELTHVKLAKQVVKVGDTASDIQEGMAAGCVMVVGITSGAFSRADLGKEGPTHLIEQIPDLLSLVIPAGH